ncbi:MAG: hypothetical protein IPP32_03090 [Bacteroidetes bacterium]|nr:hypothetical protein [Bacteroidota bacterium]
MEQEIIPATWLLFVDVNQDGIYNPLAGGDYPLIKVTKWPIGSLMIT